MSTEHTVLDEILTALPGVDREGVTFEATSGFPSVFPVAELASTAIAAAGLAAARLSPDQQASSTHPRVTVNRRLASAWFDRSIRPLGWELPPLWDPLTGDYRTRTGWIRLHTNAPHHRAAMLSVLGTEATREAVTAAVSAWDGDTLEAAIAITGGCSAALHTPDTWSASEQGQAVTAEPLIAWRDLSTDHSAAHTAIAPSSRPLAGVRVLDLTRVLAGPVATRFLALLGADVLRVDPPGWEESVIPEVTLGKRTARLDLTAASDRNIFTTLLASADVLVHGYRPGALDSLCYDENERQRIRPGLIDLALDAYGWSGPLAGRRGFDSLVQMSCGIAAAGMMDTGADHPIPLPVQALDHATGYLLAAAALSALAHRRDTGVGRSARLSLARTAQLLLARRGMGAHEFFPPTPEDVSPRHEETSWGPALRLRHPISIVGITLDATPARALGRDAPLWR
ncbi:CoA transferase [Klugiella xanthotipulae]|uniref:CoA transferase family III n=1 Tax=Klugiella xanthotipulae TaxID=244735 RepID=A0A543HYL9_9MICO|nr:CoA transferase [Klugiella xanthotipulae]TQM63436.1 CoA transferase family III [Klugiella xanthotipulae]